MSRREATLTAFKERLRTGEAVLGIQHNTGSEAVLELAGACGYGFAVIDMEHSAYGLADVEKLLRAAELAEIVGLVRVPSEEPHVIARVLDAGAAGVMVPHVRDAETCLRAVQACRYQPLGTRGKSSMSRAARWGTQPWGEYASWALSGPLMIPILEDPDAIDRMDEIAAVPGLEVIALGPGDLSQAYGKPDEGLRCEQVWGGLQKAIDLGRKHNLSVMTIPAPDMNPSFVNEIVQMGVQLIWYGSDLSHLLTALRRAREGVHLRPEAVDNI